LRVAGDSTPFWIASLFLLLGSILVSTLPPDEAFRKSSWELYKIFRKLKEGFRFISQHRTVMAPLSILISAQVVVSLFVVVFPSYAVDVLKIDLRDAGPFLITPLGTGAILGAVFLNRLIARWRKRKIIGYGAFLASFCLFFLAIIVGLFQEITGAVAVLMFLLGFGAVSILIPTQTFLQEQTPESFRARVFGALGFMITLASLPPVLFAGAIADIFGVTFILLSVATVTLVFGLIMSKEKYAFF
jgi:acyl-[acyl-carrier-protein]-phospholipid O-acyltransferase/long-chain-fatty-acid--[acyl-carrier-protein] ligase